MRKISREQIIQDSTHNGWSHSVSQSLSLWRNCVVPMTHCILITHPSWSVCVNSKVWRKTQELSICLPLPTSTYLYQHPFSHVLFCQQFQQAHQFFNLSLEASVKKHSLETKWQLYKQEMWLWGITMFDYKHVIIHSMCVPYGYYRKAQNWHHRYTYMQLLTFILAWL